MHLNRQNIKQSNRVLIILINFLLGIFTSYAQEKQETNNKDQLIFNIAVTAKTYEDSIVLRWGPSDPIAWRMGMGKGYQIIRVAYLQGGKTDTTILTTTAILPQTLEQMKATARKDDKYMAIAAQAMYSDQFRLSNDAPESGSLMDKIRQGSDMFMLKYYFAMQTADLSKEAANALGLRFVDKDVKKDGAYQYIVLTDTISASYAILPGTTLVTKNQKLDGFYPEGLVGFGGDHKVELHWYREQMMGYTAYYVERSDDGGATYHRLYEDPFYSSYDPLTETQDSTGNAKIYNSILKDNQMLFDSIPENYKDYYYRIAGIDAFADVSAYSPPIIIHGVDKMPPEPVVIDSVVNFYKNHVYLKWVEQENAPDLLGYYVARGSEPKGPFVPLHDKLLDKNIKSYIDTTANALEKIYYVVVSVDTAKNLSYSLPHVGILVDSIAPNAPLNLSGAMDTLGHVLLRWDINKEPDLAGYRVYTSYNPNNDFSIITSYLVTDNYYLDSISTRSLDRRVYYKVVAVDRNGNHSTFSKSVTIEKPILIAPTAPVSSSISTQEEGIFITWNGSSSEGVWGYEIYRRDTDSHTFDTIAHIQRKSIEEPNFSYLDTSALGNIYYLYSASSIDSTGLRSNKSKEVKGYLHKVNSFKNITSFTAEYDKKQGVVNLSWVAPTQKGNYYFVIYRAEGDKALESIRSLGKEATSYSDTMLNKNVNYRYAIEIREENGPGKSPEKKEAKVSID